MMLLRATYLSVSEHRDLLSAAGYSEVAVFEERRKGLDLRRGQTAVAVEGLTGCRARQTAAFVRPSPAVPRAASVRSIALNERVFYIDGVRREPFSAI